MAITPNVPNEQTNKAALRGVTRGGSTPTLVNPPIDVALYVNAEATTSGILELSVGTGNSTFTISGSNGLVTSTLTGTSTGSTVANLITALAAGPLSGQTFYVNAGGANYLYDTTTSIITTSGATLTVISGTGTTPTITAFALSGTLGQTYPNYVGTPNATPNWIDDVTVHYPVVSQYGQIVGGLVLASGGVATSSGAPVAQHQVRQILTQPSETQQYAGYFATYSGNLTQTGQKNTRRQQA